MNSKITETLTLDNGYKGIFCQADGPENPLREDYGHPPSLTRFWDRHGWSKWSNPGSGCTSLDWQDLFNLIPDEKFSDSNISDTLQKLGAFEEFTECPVEMVKREARHWETEIREAVRDMIKDTDWTDKIEFLETLASLAGIPYLASTCNGYCQGDHAEIFSAITPAWIEGTGCPPEYFESAMKEAARQYGAWAWGTVYYLETLIRPDGTEIDAADLCMTHDHYGFVSDKESGCMETLREAAEIDAAADAKERAEREAWAARDSVTVP